jgi:hypothetical protein
VIPLREISVMGVLVAPFALCVPMAILITYGGLSAFRGLRPSIAWSRSPAFELWLLVVVLSGLVLTIGRG